MRGRESIREYSEAAQSIWDDVRTFWRQDIWPLLGTVWVFLVMAAPILLVILVLWYLDSIGWRAGPGFYTIG